MKKKLFILFPISLIVFMLYTKVTASPTEGNLSIQTVYPHFLGIRWEDAPIWKPLEVRCRVDSSGWITGEEWYRGGRLVLFDVYVNLFGRNGLIDCRGYAGGVWDVSAQPEFYFFSNTIYIPMVINPYTVYSCNWYPEYECGVLDYPAHLVPTPAPIGD